MSDALSMESIVDKMPGGVAIVEHGFKSILKFYNSELVSYSGYTPEEFEATFPKNIILMVHPLDREALQLSFVSLKKTPRRVIEVAFRIIRKDGSLGWLLARVRLVSVHLGTSTYYCLFSDITNRKKRDLQTAWEQEQLKRQYDFLENIYLTIPCGIVQCTFETHPRIISVNQMGAAMMGLGKDVSQILAQRRDLLKCVVPEDRERLIGQFRLLLAKEKETPFECRLIGSSEPEMWISGTMDVLLRPELLKIVQLVFVDSTEAKRQEKALEEKQLELKVAYAKLQLAFEQSAIKMWEYDIRTKNIRSLQSDIAKYGSPDLPELKNLSDQDETFQQKFLAMQDAIIKRLERGETPVETTLLWGDDHGKDRWQRIRYTLMFNNDGTPLTAIGIAKDVSDEVETMEKYKAQREEALNLKEKASHEGLTGLLNRQAFTDLVTESLAAMEEGSCGAFYILDIDDFKNINDTLGHDTGDEALCFVAATLKRLFRTSDYIARLGGDEFVAFMRDVPTRKLVIDRARTICHAMKDWSRNSSTVSLTVSMGVAMAPESGSSFEELYHHADNALYLAKHKGKDRCQVFGEDDA